MQELEQLLALFAAAVLLAAAARRVGAPYQPGPAMRSRARRPTLEISDVLRSRH